jgi:tRNA(Arg) A34 adenosine deaminase TadA
MDNKDKEYMTLALEEAKKSASRDEVPVGAVIVHKDTGKILSASGNRTIELSDPTAHAEINAIREACAKEGAQRIPEYNLYVTLEPCAMCAAAISFARINTLIFGAEDPKGGAVINGPEFFNQPTCHHHIKIKNGLMGDQCGQILKDFFAGKR